MVQCPGHVTTLDQSEARSWVTGSLSANQRARSKEIIPLTPAPQHTTPLNSNKLLIRAQSRQAHLSSSQAEIDEIAEQYESHIEMVTRRNSSSPYLNLIKIKTLVTTHLTSGLRELSGLAMVVPLDRLDIP